MLFLDIVSSEVDSVPTFLLQSLEIHTHILPHSKAYKSQRPWKHLVIKKKMKIDVPKQVKYIWIICRRTWYILETENIVNYVIALVYRDGSPTCSFHISWAFPF